MADKSRKVAKGLAWLVRKMGVVDAVDEFKKAYKPDPKLQAQRDAAAVEESMRQLAICILQYRARHGRFPHDLAELVEKGLATAKEMVTDRTEPDRPAKDRLPAFDESDYVYLPLGADCDDDMILMYEPPERHGGKGTRVTLASGEVVWMDGEQFDRARKRTEEYLRNKQG